MNLNNRYIYSRASRVYVRAGSTNSESGGRMYSTSLYIIHPMYNPATSDYDVAVVKLLKPIKLDGTSTKVVPLPDEGTEVPAGTEVLVSGWGDTSVSLYLELTTLIYNNYQPLLMTTLTYLTN